MKKNIQIRFSLVLVLILFAGFIKSQTFGPAQNNPFSITGFGTITTPAFGDLDGDGDIDMLAGDLDGNFYGYENIGTPAAPAFNTPFINPFGLADVGDYSNPVFVDLDNDGDLDLMSGESTGDFIYFENTGTAIAPAFGPAQFTPFSLSILPEGKSAPDFVDIDNDGDLDLLAGNAAGTFEYFQNMGTASAPSFGVSSADPFGLIGIGNDSRPAFTDLDGDGDFDLLVGSLAGDFLYFENDGTVASPTFSAAPANPFLLTNIGSNSDATLADMDNDGDLDLMSGENTSGFYYFEQIPCTTLASPTDTTPVANLTICAGNNTLLYATGSGTIGWYDAAIGGTWLGGGTSFVTPVLSDTVTYYAQDSSACGMSVTRTAITVNVNALPVVFINGNDTICNGQNTMLTANGASTYVWTAGPSTASYTVSPSTDAMYYVSGTDLNGCVNTDSVMIKVNALPVITISGITTICNGETTTLTANGANTYLWSGGPSTASYSVSPSTNTTYSVLGIDTNNCFNNASLTVTVKPLPDVSTFVLGSAATATNFTADTYQWVFCNFWITAPGVSNTQVYVSVFSADYAVIITQNGCTDTSACVTLAAIGVKENNMPENVFTVFPNPASTSITVNSNVTFNTVKIIDVNGKIVITQPCGTNSVGINTAELHNGFYFIQLMNGETTLPGMQKLLINH